MVLVSGPRVFPDVAWGVGFSDGFPQYYAGKGSQRFVRAVRGGP